MKNQFYMHIIYTMKFARSVMKSLKCLKTPIIITIVALMCLSVYFLTSRCKCTIEGLEDNVDEKVEEKDTATTSLDGSSDVEKTSVVTKIMSKLDTDVLKYLGTLSDKQRDALIEELNDKNEEELDNYSKMSVDEVKKMVDGLDSK